MKALALVEAYIKARNELIVFECPFCKGNAQGMTAENGHIRVKCDSCNIKIIS